MVQQSSGRLCGRGGHPCWAEYYPITWAWRAHDLLVERFDRVGAGRFGAVLSRVGHVGEDVMFAVTH